MSRDTTTGVVGNPVDARHVAQAFDEVREVSAYLWRDVTDAELILVMEHLAIAMRDAHRGAEFTHECAKRLAAAAIEYMARGLA